MKGTLKIKPQFTAQNVMSLLALITFNCVATSKQENEKKRNYSKGMSAIDWNNFKFLSSLNTCAQLNAIISLINTKDNFSYITTIHKAMNTIV